MNKGLLMDPVTGEIITGATYYTDEQIAAMKRANWMDSQQKQYGIFIWLLYNVGTALDWGLSPDAITKVIYISTYMDYDNKLKHKGDLLTKKKLCDLLEVSTPKFYKFYNEVIEKEIIVEDEDGAIQVNSKLFCKGKATNLKKSSADFTRVYVNSVRTLYKFATPREHKALSYIYQAIPFTNYNYNMLCFNPKEPSLDNIVAMQFEEYCQFIGYSVENARRLKQTMKKFTVKDMPVFSFVENNNGTFCYINPYVHYAGDKWDEVEVLGRFRKKNDLVSVISDRIDYNRIKFEIDQIKREVDVDELY